MKKIFITFFVFIALNGNYVSAEGCLIEGDMAPVLKEYIENTDKVLAEIETKANENLKKEDLITEIELMKEEIVLAYNKAFDFDNSYANIKFDLELPKNIEIPEEIERDLKKLKENGKKIGKKIESIVRSGIYESEIRDFCNNFQDLNCNIPNKIKAIDLLSRVLLNYRHVENTYIYTVLGDGTGKYNLEFVKDDFYKELEKYYGEPAYSECNAIEGRFLENALEKIEKLWDSGKKIKDGIKKLIDAGNMLVGKDMSEYEKKEKEMELLKKELKKQGIYSSEQISILKTLDRYNQEQTPANNNFIEYIFSNIRTEINRKISAYKAEKLEDFIKNNLKNDEEGKMITIKNISVAKNNKRKTNFINEKIKTIYARQLPFTQISDSNSDGLRTKLINTHIEFLESIEILRESCPKAVKICNEQDSGAGDCGKCK